MAAFLDLISDHCRHHGKSPKSGRSKSGTYLAQPSCYGAAVARATSPIARRPTRSIVVKATRTPRGCDGRSSGAEHPFRHHQIGPRIPPVPAARARQGAWRVEPPDHGMEHQADVHPQLRLILPDAGPGCEKNGRRATWAVTTRSGRHQVPVAVLPTAKSLSAFSLKPQSDRLLAGGFFFCPKRNGPSVGGRTEAALI